MDAQLESGTHEGSQGHSHCLSGPHHLAELCSLQSALLCMCACECVCACAHVLVIQCVCARASTDECILCIFPVYTFLQSSSACVRLKKEETQGHISGQRTHRSHAQLKHCCSSLNPARERRRGSRTCLIHCFDLACRLQDLKRTASNRMPQMVKVLL